MFKTLAWLLTLILTALFLFTQTWEDKIVKNSNLKYNSEVIIVK